MVIGQKKIMDGDFLKEEKKKEEVHLPFGYFEKADEEWISDFKRFVECEGKEALANYLYEVNALDVVKEEMVKTIKDTFRRLKRIDPHLYDEVMTPDFLSFFLFRASGNFFSVISAETEKEFLAWIRKEYKKKPVSEDMWNTLKRLYGGTVDNTSAVLLDIGKLTQENFGFAQKFLDYIEVWKKCFGEYIEVDMEDPFQSEVIYAAADMVLNNAWFVGADTYIGRLLTGVSYFHNTPTCSATIEVGKKIMSEKNGRENMNVALRKNLISREVAYKTAERILSRDTEKMEYLPMLIWKVHEDKGQVKQ